MSRWRAVNIGNGRPFSLTPTDKAPSGIAPTTGPCISWETLAAMQWASTFLAAAAARPLTAHYSSQYTAYGNATVTPVSGLPSPASAVLRRFM